MAEQGICNAQVGGSSPLPGSVVCVFVQFLFRNLS